MPTKPGAPTDDLVVDWGPDAGTGLFDPPEVTAGGNGAGRDVTDGRVGREVTANPTRERPMAVLAWIGATLTTAPGTARGDVPGLAALLAEEPLELLPGGFFPIREAAPGGGEGTDDPKEVGPIGAPSAEPPPEPRALPHLAVTEVPPPPPTWPLQVAALLICVALVAFALWRSAAG